MTTNILLEIIGIGSALVGIIVGFILGVLSKR